jgi:hypothetical protein
MTTDTGSSCESPATLYPDFARNRVLGVVLLAFGLGGVISLISQGADASGGLGPATLRGLYDLFWVFCGAAYLQHPRTRLRDWMRRSAIACLSLLALTVLGVLIGTVVSGAL